MPDREKKRARRSASIEPSVDARLDLSASASAGVTVPHMSDDGAVVAILDTDLNGAITRWNRAAERLFGYSATEAVGQPLDLVVPPARQPEQDELANRVQHGERIDRIE